MMLLRLPSHWMSLSSSLSVGFTSLHDITSMVNNCETVFKFTAVTPVEGNSAWLTACCRLDVLEANIVVFIVAAIFIYNIAWLAFFGATVSGTIFDGLFDKKARILCPLRLIRICWCAILLIDLILPSMVSLIYGNVKKFDCLRYLSVYPLSESLVKKFP